MDCLSATIMLLIAVSFIVVLIVVYLAQFLTGTLPPELSGMVDMTFIYMDKNLLTGRIPPQYGSFAQMKWIYLNSNVSQ